MKNQTITIELPRRDALLLLQHFQDMRDLEAVLRDISFQDSKAAKEARNKQDNILRDITSLMLYLEREVNAQLNAAPEESQADKDTQAYFKAAKLIEDLPTRTPIMLPNKPTISAAFHEMFSLLDDIMHQNGDTIWADGITTGHDALLGIAARYGEALLLSLQARMEADNKTTTPTIEEIAEQGMPPQKMKAFRVHPHHGRGYVLVYAYNYAQAVDVAYHDGDWLGDYQLEDLVAIHCPKWDKYCKHEKPYIITHNRQLHKDTPRFFDVEGESE